MQPHHEDAVRAVCLKDRIDDILNKLMENNEFINENGMERTLVLPAPRGAVMSTVFPRASSIV